MQIYGCADESLSKHLKCIIKQGDVAIVGKIPDGYSKSLQHRWISPFEDDSVGSVMEKPANLLQATTGNTAVTKFNSILTWEGSEAMQIDIPLFFEAEMDAKNEVFLPGMFLEVMSAPVFSVKSDQDKSYLKQYADKLKNDAKNFFTGNLSEWFNGLGGKIPRPVYIKIGGNLILRDCVIESTSVEDPMIYDQKGYPLHWTVTLSIKTKSTLDAMDLLNTYEQDR